MAFVQRAIDLTFQIGPNSNSGQQQSFASGTNTAKVTGLRTSVRIQHAATPGLAMAEIAVYGLQLDVMNALSTLGMAYQLVPPNYVTVQAGSIGSAMTTVFTGYILQAYIDFNNAPDIPFRIEAQTLGFDSASLVPPKSSSGSTDVSTLAEQLANQMGCTLENNGVSGSLPNAYLWGSPRTQMQQCADAHGFDWTVENKTLAIWPKGGFRFGQGSTPIISRDTGMIGYPSYTIYGMLVKTLFNPSLRYGTQFQLQSTVLKPANGVYTVFSLDHTLESQVIHGKWETLIEAFNPKIPYKTAGPTS